MLYEDNYLAHFGILGMKWGVRRWQNPDGSLTEAGKRRYGSSSAEVRKLLDDAKAKHDKAQAKYNDLSNHMAKKALAKAEKEVSKVQNIYDNLVKSEERAEEESQKRKMLYSEGVQKAKDDFNKIEEMKDLNQKAKAMEDLLQKASDALGPYNDSTYPGYDEEGDSKSQAYDIGICTLLDRKIKGLCDPLGLGVNYKYDSRAGTPGIKKKMDELEKIEWAAYEEKDEEQHFKEIDKAYDSLYEQVLKDIGLSVTENNKKNIEKFIQNDSFYDPDFDPKRTSSTFGLIGGRKGILQNFKNRWKAMYLPPEMMNKSKEEQKIWEDKEKAKFIESSEKYKEGQAIIKDTKNFDKLSKEEQKNAGDKVLKYIDDYVKNRDLNNIDENLEKNLGSLETWISTRVSAKSGTDVSVQPKTEANRIAKENYNGNLEKMSQRSQEIKKNINFDQNKIIGPNVMKPGSKAAENRAKELARLTDALNSDKLYSALKANEKKFSNDWASVVLKDMGFRDTPENRAIIWPYIIEIWD